MRIGWLVIGTNRYAALAADLARSIHEHFRAPGAEATIFCFTNHPDSPPGTRRVGLEHQPWPLVTLLRYHTFLRHRDQLERTDYLVYIDADMRLVAPVGAEILGDRIAALHPGYFNRPRTAFTYESRPESRAYVPPHEGQHYYYGALQGGRTDLFLRDCQRLAEAINEDLRRNLIARWHDESHWNRYLIDHPPTRVLTPEYCYVDGYDLPFTPRIRALVKDHEAVRAEPLAVAGGTP